MILLQHKNFKKKAAKLPAKVKMQLRERVALFLICPFDPALNNHGLHGDFAGCRSINVTGDLRLIYKIIDSTTIFFVDVDTHSNLY